MRSGAEKYHVGGLDFIVEHPRMNHYGLDIGTASLARLGEHRHVVVDDSDLSSHVESGHCCGIDIRAVAYDQDLTGVYTRHAREQHALAAAEE